MRRILELDALRGIAAVVVMLAHIGLIADTAWVLSSVDLFFVLSGYFITTNILKNREAPRFLSVFFTRRALRIWPAYYVALAACLILNRYLKFDAPAHAWPQYLTFTQNLQAYMKWPLPSFSLMFQHTWTLAIEEQFYILWPVLLFKTGRRTTLAVILAFIAMPAIGRLYGYSPYLLLTRCDGLAFGSLLGLVVSDRELVARYLTRYRIGFGVIAVSAVFLPMVCGAIGGYWLERMTGFAWNQLAPALFTSRASIAYFGLAGLTLCLQGHRATVVLRERRLCYLGTISYGLYLYHPMVFAALPGLYKRYVVRRLGVTNHLLMDLTMLGVCFALAELSRRYLEGPIMALKDRLRFTSTGNTPVAYDMSPAYRGPHSTREHKPLSVEARKAVR